MNDEKPVNHPPQNVEHEKDSQPSGITLNHYEAPAFLQYTNIFTDAFAY
jgi:hypothetical protein